MRAGPACGGEQFIACGFERTQVGLVLPSALVDRRVELEVDLIKTAREVNRERLTVVTALEAIDEPVGQAEVEQVGRGGVQPALGEPEVAGDPITRGDQLAGERTGLDERLPREQGDDVDVARRPADQAFREQRRPTDNDEFGVGAASSQLLPQCFQQLDIPLT